MTMTSIVFLIIIIPKNIIEVKFETDVGRIDEDKVSVLMFF